jgi:hypothetical protein
MGQIQQDREVNRMNKRIGEKGLIKGIFIVLVLVGVAFLLISYGRPYYRYYVLGSHTRDILKSEIGRIETIRTKIMEEANELNVPLDEENLEVVLDKKIIRVNASWTDTVDFWGYYQTKIDFSINEEY